MNRSDQQRRARWIGGGLALGVLAWSAAGAGAQDPQSGGTIVMAREADIFTFDPYNTQDDRSIFTELTIYDRLVKLSDDGKSVEPELATSWTVAADGLTRGLHAARRRQVLGRLCR